MTPKTKKISYRILKVIWFLIGFLILLITFLLYLKMYSASGLGVIAVALLFSVGIYSLFIYIGITLLFLIIKWLIKKIRKRKLK
jgi:hypothetical protein